MIYIFLANGFEDIEALATADILKRAGLDIKTVGIGNKQIETSHGLKVICDYNENEIDIKKADMIILPGGMPGTKNLAESKIVKDALEFCIDNDKYIAAICAAPSVLGKYGLLYGKKFTCYPSFEEGINGKYTKDKVTVDGKIITGIGPGATFDFAFEIVKILCGSEKVKALKKSMQC